MVSAEARITLPRAWATNPPASRCGSGIDSHSRPARPLVSVAVSASALRMTAPKPGVAPIFTRCEIVTLELVVTQAIVIVIAAATSMNCDVKIASRLLHGSASACGGVEAASAAGLTAASLCASMSRTNARQTRPTTTAAQPITCQCMRQLPLPDTMASTTGGPTVAPNAPIIRYKPMMRAELFGNQAASR